MELGDVTADTEIVLKEEFDETGWLIDCHDVI